MDASAALLSLLFLSAPAGGSVKPPAEPAKIAIAVEPAAVAPGSQAKVTVRLTPGPGIKINRYPKMKVQVPAREGLVAAAEAAVGSTEPPPLDKPEANYYRTVDPIEVALAVDPAAPKAKHAVPAKVTYYYCVAASGFCAPAKVDVSIPLTVR